MQADHLDTGLRQTIASKEAEGGDATFERQFYKSWLKYPEYARADKESHSKGFYGELSSVKNKREDISKIIPDISDISQNFETSQEGVLSPDTFLQALINGNKRGRPRKFGEVSRTTAWRREKEAVQGVLV